MFKSPLRNLPSPKGSPVSFIKTVTSPRHLNSPKSNTPTSFDFSIDNSPRQLGSALLALEITQEKHNLPHKCMFPFTEDTTIADLRQFIARQLHQPLLYFKSRDLNVDYLMTLGHRKVKELKTKRLELSACRIRVDSKGALLRNFDIIKCVGTGGFSRVYLCRGYGQLMALKVINKDFIVQNQKMNIIENQRTILELCSGHPFVTKLYASFQTKNYLFFCMEYCNGGQLFNLLRKVRRMTQNQAKFYFLQTLSAISHLHSQKILYRDLKPQNIIIDSDGHIRLADYGLSKIMKDGMTHSFCGSAEYMAPEMLLKKGHSFEIDYYCLGALLYELLLGLPPYYSRNQSELFNNILTKDLQFPPNVEISKQLKKFLHRMLQKDTDLRFKKISEIINHPWLQDVNMQDVFNKKLVPPFKTEMFQNNFDQSEFAKDEEKERLKLERQKDLPKLDQDEVVFQDFSYISKEMQKIESDAQKESQKKLDFTKKPPQGIMNSGYKESIRNTNLRSIDNSKFYLQNRYGQNSPRVIPNYTTQNARSSDKFKMFISQTPQNSSSYGSQLSSQLSHYPMKTSDIVNGSNLELSNSSNTSKLVGVRSVPLIEKMHAYSPGHERVGSPININNYINIYTNKTPSKGPQISFTTPAVNFIGSPKKTMSYGNSSFEKSVANTSIKNTSNTYGSINGSLERIKFSSLDKPLIGSNTNSSSGFLKNNVYYQSTNPSANGSTGVPARSSYLTNFRERQNPNQKIKKSYKTNDKFSFNGFSSSTVLKH